MARRTLREFAACIDAPATAGADGASVAGEKVRIRAVWWALSIGNSQSDGIAANHSRKLTMQLGFEQSVALLSAEHAKTR